ncbi:hypothetical protein GGG17_12635 [Arsenicicoccus sp. MKL-02]|uniref:Uncharacterized protein n=1 Tax=Arsenicicoccus cauae TaxID=2663847 RepID=A0A6I3IJG1_9MICO|nr:hypothetical protein [Arsenicicoccus cauae]MTB72793.1 hypothetical protein [Arsenicicoccus cauae]
MIDETPYQKLLAALGDGTSRQALALLAAFLDGLLSFEEALTAIAATIARANGHGTALADVALAATLTEQTGHPVPVLGLAPAADDLDRLRKAVDTILTDGDLTDDAARETARMRTERLGRNEPIDAAGRAFNDGIARSPHVTGYRRGLTADACQLCQWLYREGHVYRAEQPMHLHPGDRCHPIPVTTTERTNS